MLFFWAAALLASSQDAAPSTITTGAASLTHEGRFQGCELTFTTSFQDNARRNDGRSIISGTFAVLGFQNESRRLVYGLKLSLNDLHGTSPDGIPEKAKISSSSIMIDETRSNSEDFIEAITSDPDSLLSAFKYSENFHTIYENLIIRNKLPISFKRENGAADISLLIDFSEPKNDGIESTRTFAACILKGLDEMTARAKE